MVATAAFASCGSSVSTLTVIRLLAGRLLIFVTTAPPSVTKRVSVEIGITLGWERYVGKEGAIIGLDHFGASAPAGTIFKEFGFTVDRVADVGRRVVREGLHGRMKALGSAHSEHPTVEPGDPGVDRTGSSDPGHD